MNGEISQQLVFRNHEPASKRDTLVGQIRLMIATEAWRGRMGALTDSLPKEVLFQWCGNREVSRVKFPLCI